MEVSDNVYADLGFENSSEMQAKSTVVAALSAKLRAGGIGLDQAAQQLQIDAAGLEKILRGQFRNVSLEKLTAMSEKLDSFPNYAAAGLKNCPNCEVGHLHQDTREMATRDKRRVEKNSNVHPT
jgi:predicted XRE-type DNA-binding protein